MLICPRWYSQPVQWLGFASAFGSRAAGCGCASHRPILCGFVLSDRSACAYLAQAGALLARPESRRRRAAALDASMNVPNGFSERLGQLALPAGVLHGFGRARQKFLE